VASEHDQDIYVGIYRIVTPRAGAVQYQIDERVSVKITQPAPQFKQRLPDIMAKYHRIAHSLTIRDYYIKRLALVGIGKYAFLLSLDIEYA
jgi:hypothetical protein